jgi:hypothetical protein
MMRKLTENSMTMEIAAPLAKWLPAKVISNMNSAGMSVAKPGPHSWRCSDGHCHFLRPYRLRRASERAPRPG